MAAPIIKRYISNDASFKDIVEDFGFLVDKIKNSGFEYDLQIRDGSFNLYYKGNSISFISYDGRKKKYSVTIPEKFVDDRMIQRFKPVLNSNNYQVFSIEKNQLHPLF